jgi:Flp pilus assembly protein TadG
MIGRIAQTLRRLRHDDSGNAMLLMAIAMPVLVSGSGLAVDMSQWYTWKRELQLASDQAALGAAWARTDTNTQDTWKDRGLQDYNANLSVTKTFASAPNFKLAGYSNGTNNSVVVTATATKALTFTSLFLTAPVTVSVYSQASFSKGANYSACLISVGKDGTTFTVGGNATIVAKCGLAALSCSDNALTIDGSAKVTTDSIAVCGTADVPDDLESVLNEKVEGLRDTFADLTPPLDNNARSYACVKSGITTTATTQVNTRTDYTYWKDQQSKNSTTFSPAKASTSTTGTPTSGTVANGTTAGTSVGTSDTFTQVGGSGNNKIYERKRVTTTTTISNVVETAASNQASLLPGTYSDITVKCKTVFSKGIYVVNGGTLDLTGNYTVTGTNVMFVLKNGATLKLGGSGNGNTVSLTPMQASDFTSMYGTSTTLANRYANMLIFEDRNNNPSSDHIINGNSTSLFQGTIYLPAGTARVNGTASLDSSCLQISAKYINILGNAYLDTRCPTTQTNSAGSSVAKVRLVA